MNYGSSSEEVNYLTHNQSDHDYTKDQEEDFNEDIYESPEESIIQDPYSLALVRDRKNTEEIEQRCTQVRSHFKTSSSKAGGMVNPLKKLVSKRKFRFNLDGFNLDLTLSDITKRIIAMGYPADDIEKYYRNSMTDVQRFFKQRHNGHYKIINLCAERKYPHSCFDNRVSEYPFEDHQAPTMALIYGMCEELDKWLAENQDNVAAIHCKAGKGRTGIMICCYLLYCKMFENSYDAMRFYGTMRTNNKKGVTIPSQIRYVIYFEQCLAKGWKLQDIPILPLRLTRIRLITIPNFNMGGVCDPWFILQNLKRGIKHMQGLPSGYKVKKTDGYIDFEFDLTVEEDVRIIFLNKGIVDKKMKMFQLWFNTSFFEPCGKMIVDKYMLDGATKDKANKKFAANFRIEIDGCFLTHPNVMKYSSNPLADTSSQINSTIFDQKQIH